MLTSRHYTAYQINTSRIGLIGNSQIPLMLHDAFLGLDMSSSTFAARLDMFIQNISMSQIHNWDVPNIHQSEQYRGMNSPISMSRHFYLLGRRMTLYTNFRFKV